MAEVCTELIVIIRPSFKKICGPDACRAALFNHILFRLANKAKTEQTSKVKKGEVFWFASAEDICQDIDSDWSVNKVRKEIKQLVDSGLVGQRHNPAKGWDRKFQYFIGEEQGKALLKKAQSEEVCLMHIGLNAEVLHLLHLVNAFNKNGGCICQKSEMDLPNEGDASTKYGGAIPEGSSKGSFKGSTEGSSTGADAPTPTQSSHCHFCLEEAVDECPMCYKATCLEHRQQYLPGMHSLTHEPICDGCLADYRSQQEKDDSYSLTNGGNDGNTNDTSNLRRPVTSRGASDAANETQFQPGQGERSSEKGMGHASGSAQRATGANHRPHSSGAAATAGSTQTTAPVSFTQSGGSSPHESAKVEPRSQPEQPSLPLKVDLGPLVMPDVTAPWNAGTAVIVSEVLREKRYTPLQRDNQLTSAKKMLKTFPEMTRAQFEQAFSDWAVWWRNHDKGFFTIADIMCKGQNKEIRLQTTLDRLDARQTLSSKPAEKPKSSSLDMTDWTDEEWDHFQRYNIVPQRARRA